MTRDAMGRFSKGTAASFTHGSERVGDEYGTPLTLRDQARRTPNPAYSGGRQSQMEEDIGALGEGFGQEARETPPSPGTAKVDNAVVRTRNPQQ